MQVITKSHISDEHAASAHFSEAVSSDGLFTWLSLSPGYVFINAALAGVAATSSDGDWHELYLQYAELDKEVSPELIALARAFVSAVYALQEVREKAADAAELEEMRAEAAALLKPGAHWLAPCDRSVPDCSLDHCTRNADGSVSRVHTH